ncbi:MAG: hypothetical protein AB1611_04520 [bacterium]
MTMSDIDILILDQMIKSFAGRYDQPERMLKIDWPSYLQFNHLAGA